MVNLGYDIAQALPLLRAQAESRMTDTVRITRGSGEPVWDESTGTYTPATTTVYEGPARLSLNSTIVSSINAQGQLLAGQSPRLDLPVATSGDVKVNDTVEITGSQNDPANVGIRLNIEGIPVQTDATARRFPVEVQS